MTAVYKRSELFTSFLYNESMADNTVFSKRLILKKVNKDDKENMYNNYALEYMSEYEFDIFFKRKLNASNPEFIVILKKDGTVIGEIGAVNCCKDKRIIEAGYRYGKRFSGNGYGSEALEMFADYIFTDTDTEKIICKCLKDNIASIRVNEKAGFNKEEYNDYILDTMGNVKETVTYYLDRNDYLGGRK